MSAAILALLTALPGIVKIVEQMGPELISIAKNFLTWLNHVSGNDPQGYIKKVGEAMSALNHANSVEERQNAAKKISQTIAGL